MYDPNSANEGGGGICTAGKKLLHGVGRNRWTSSSGRGTVIEDIEFVVLRNLGSDDQSDVGKRVTGRFFMTDKSMWRFGKYCLAQGQHEPFNHDDPNEMERVISLGPVIGQVFHDSYNGKTNPRVEEFTAWSGQQDPGWDEVIAEGEASYKEWRSKMESGGSSSGRSGGGSSSSGGGGGGGGGGQRGGHSGPDDDIPF